LENDRMEFRPSRVTKIHLAAAVAAALVGAILIPAELGGLLPDDLTLPRILLIAVMAYGFVFAVMFRKAGLALKQDS
jgi:hypothetical protein